MDISLHSFILAIGLVVITFIVWDGIKRVRESRNSSSLDNLDILDGEGADPSQEYSSADYDDLEIADDLLQSDFIAKLSDEKLTVGELDDSALVDIRVPLEEKKVAPKINVQTSKPVSVSVSVQEEPLKQVKDPDQGLAAKPPKTTIESVLEVKEPELEIESLLDGQQAVPVLMEPVELGGEVESNPPKQQELHLPEFVQIALNEEPITIDVSEPELDPLFTQVKESLEVEEKSAPQQSEIIVHPVGEKLAERAAAQEIIVINILKEKEPLLKGQDISQVFKACDMRFGEMDIFHRFEQANAQGKIQFSVVNALKPGSFNMSSMDEMETSGISLFMSLPGPNNPMEAFDAMSEVALVFARNFNASLYDDSHSDLTPQTLEHYRNRVREFTRKHMPLNK